MAKYKGSGNDTILKLMTDRGLKEAFLSKLSPKDKELYSNSLSIKWFDIPTTPGDLGVAADLLFPGDPDKMVKLGTLMARQQIHGLYQIFFRIPTVGFVMKRIPQLWKMQFDTGQMHLTEFQENQCTFTLKDYPELPDYLIDQLGGYIITVLEFCGKKGITLEKDNHDPNAWKWILRWL